MAVVTDRQHLLAVARGDQPADLVVRDRACSASSRASGSRATSPWRTGGLPASEATRARDLDAGGSMLVPGFIDAHVHIESSMLTLERFAEVVLATGTTTIVADPHELANVVGSKGVHWLLDAAEQISVERVRHGAIVRAGEQIRVSTGAAGPRGDGGHPAARGSPGRGGDDGLPGRHRGRRLCATEDRRPRRQSRRRPRAGRQRTRVECLPRRRRHLGPRGDHPRGGPREAPERRLDLIREASNARNLRERLVPMVRRYGPERCAFCTDDREADVLVDEGHIDGDVPHGLCGPASPSRRPWCWRATTGLSATGSTTLARSHRVTAPISPSSQTTRSGPRRVYKDGRVVAIDGEAVSDRHTDAARVGRGHGSRRSTDGVRLRDPRQRCGRAQ